MMDWRAWATLIFAVTLFLAGIAALLARLFLDFMARSFI